MALYAQWYSMQGLGLTCFVAFWAIALRDHVTRIITLRLENKEIRKEALEIRIRTSGLKPWLHI